MSIKTKFFFLFNQIFVALIKNETSIKQTVSKPICLWMKGWKKERKHVVGVGSFITLGEAISWKLMSDLMTAAKHNWWGEYGRSRLKAETAEFPHMNKCDGKSSLAHCRCEPENLSPHFILPCKNVMIRDSPQLLSAPIFSSDSLWHLQLLVDVGWKTYWDISLMSLCRSKQI